MVDLCSLGPDIEVLAPEDLRAAVAARKQVLHVAVHSFTPVLHGERRNADVGLLYDPARPRERAFRGAPVPPPSLTRRT